MKLTDKQRKALWIAGGVLTVVHFVVPNVVNAVRGESAAYRFAHAKPSPAIPAPDPVSPRHDPPVSAATATPVPVQTNAPSADAQFSKLIGIWGGSVPRLNIGVCDIRLELRAGQDKPGFSGYSTINCANAQRFRPNAENAADWMLDTAPVSAILSGEIENGSIELHQDKAIGATRAGCNITGLTLTPFGDSNVAATWKEGPAPSCEGEQVVLHRLPR